MTGSDIDRETTEPKRVAGRAPPGAPSRPKPPDPTNPLKIAPREPVHQSHTRAHTIGDQDQPMAYLQTSLEMILEGFSDHGFQQNARLTETLVETVRALRALGQADVTQVSRFPVRDALQPALDYCKAHHAPRDFVIAVRGDDPNVDHVGTRETASLGFRHLLSAVLRGLPSGTQTSPEGSLVIDIEKQRQGAVIFFWAKGFTLPAVDQFFSHPKSESQWADRIRQDSRVGDGTLPFPFTLTSALLNLGREQLHEGVSGNRPFLRMTL